MNKARLHVYTCLNWEFPGAFENIRLYIFREILQIKSQDSVITVTKLNNTFFFLKRILYQNWTDSFVCPMVYILKVSNRIQQYDAGNKHIHNYAHYLGIQHHHHVISGTLKSPEHEYIFSK